MMTLDDMKLYIINGSSFAISLTDIDLILKIILLIVTIGYTINKWFYMRKNDKNSKKNS